MKPQYAIYTGGNLSIVHYGVYPIRKVGTETILYVDELREYFVPESVLHIVDDMLVIDDALLSTGGLVMRHPDGTVIKILANTDQMELYRNFPPLKDDHLAFDLHVGPTVFPYCFRGFDDIGGFIFTANLQPMYERIL